jgi:hypothetical protein
MNQKIFTFVAKDVNHLGKKKDTLTTKDDKFDAAMLRIIKVIINHSIRK